MADFEGQSELVAANQCGMVIPPEDPCALATAVAFLARNEDQRRTMGENGRRLVVEQHSWDDRAAMTAAILEEFLALQPVSEVKTHLILSLLAAYLLFAERIFVEVSTGGRGLLPVLDFAIVLTAAMVAVTQGPRLVGMFTAQEPGQPLVPVRLRERGSPRPCGGPERVPGKDPAGISGRIQDRLIPRPRLLPGRLDTGRSGALPSGISCSLESCNVALLRWHSTVMRTKSSGIPGCNSSRSGIGPRKCATTSVTH